jgi:hypothetical protein
MKKGNLLEECIIPNKLGKYCGTLISAADTKRANLRIAVSLDSEPLAGRVRFYLETS